MTTPFCLYGLWDIFLVIGILGRSSRRNIFEVGVIDTFMWNRGWNTPNKWWLGDRMCAFDHFLLIWVQISLVCEGIGILLLQNSKKKISVPAFVKNVRISCQGVVTFLMALVTSWQEFDFHITAICDSQSSILSSISLDFCRAKVKLIGRFSTLLTIKIELYNNSSLPVHSAPKL